ncbi:shikimate kinase [Tuwongella immobilis]|uniref:Shikimate kinase n=1 Tax=Tuwongella immobilis TaxID=692036 RepID=A0A6C2YW07_9BACT|nr:shikimate kinase [Tuwongella immobilis]VIP05085.1 shikimate kinase : Shikimate kinase OS=Pirellula staleyi (strain ATCC 27377 / DSM 6068 / ICPB 4128) GN=aroK PE=3 SV=1: SKI [Tuwongella immobilis]VTS07526.1 shikimate kinase : Shikimate kinase OS=Pirellula staleyi (strain ATCC 27377 / DSM 6068 / ICPB 4128) GN=aroK PE=3 SV=1: SKI [Tuwongella immobilis]
MTAAESSSQPGAESRLPVPASRVFLIGYRGTGKSTLARGLATALGWEMIDADVYLETKAGRTIQAIFQTEGEPAFRDLESAVLRELSERDHCVIATGGGVILRPENRERLRRGFVVWLTASAERIADRLELDPTTQTRRPNLTATGGLTEIQTLLAQREPLYRACADLVVDTNDATPETLVQTIRTSWNQ